LLDDKQLTDDIIDLTRWFDRSGYGMITGSLDNAGWHVNHKHPSRGFRANHCRAVLERIWRWAGLKVQKKGKKKGAAFPD
jgi:hypothetical protein